MRAARLLPVSPSMHCTGRGEVTASGPGGYLPLVRGWVGTCLWSGGEGVVCPSMQWGRPPPPWTEWLTDRCKNITFANFICGRQKFRVYIPPLRTLKRYLRTILDTLQCISWRKHELHQFPSHDFVQNDWSQTPVSTNKESVIGSLIRAKL